MKDQIVTIRLEKEILDKLDALAIKNHVTRSWVIQNAIRHLFNKTKAKKNVCLQI